MGKVDGIEYNTDSAFGPFPKFAQQALKTSGKFRNKTTLWGKDIDMMLSCDIRVIILT